MTAPDHTLKKVKKSLHRRGHPNMHADSQAEPLKAARVAVIAEACHSWLGSARYPEIHAYTATSADRTVRHPICLHMDTAMPEEKTGP